MHKQTTFSARLNERFTDLADKISTFLGDWKFSVISLALLGLWTLYGAVALASMAGGWFTSQQWNFPLNTITTVGEWFIGALVAAAANRVERRGHEQAARQERLEQMTARMERQHGAMLVELREVLADLHAHTVCTGHTVIESAPGASPAPVPVPAVKRSHHRKAATA